MICTLLTQTNAIPDLNSNANSNSKPFPTLDSNPRSDSTLDPNPNSNPKTNPNSNPDLNATPNLILNLAISKTDNNLNLNPNLNPNPDPKPHYTDWSKPKQTVILGSNDQIMLKPHLIFAFISIFDDLAKRANFTKYCLKSWIFQKKFCLYKPKCFVKHLFYFRSN